ncbi:MAG: YdiU family protein [Methylobacteriaceae bacterium]|nr:YdiU family protein [Methylobacteriaceae bacterium]
MALVFDNTYARLPELFFSRTPPHAPRAPELGVFNWPLARRLGLEAADEATLARWFSGAEPPPGAEPISQAYAGHQFGGFSILGDGRASLLGEVVAPDGRRFDIQLKGSGRTPFSRRGDGKAALGPMLREFLVSEAMQALGVATTRSLAVVATGEGVAREDMLPGAVLTRVASSHLRVGTFQYAQALRDREALSTLVEYALARHAPERAGAARPAPALFDHVMEKQIDLVAAWMRVGFIHGVMNTDNMAISGETIDYGPCAFLDDYHPLTVFSSIDERGRYAFANQPRIAAWNLARFAEALLPLFADEAQAAIDLAQQRIDAFEPRFRARWIAMMRGKLGLIEAREEDGALADDLLSWMADEGADYTNTFRALAEGETEGAPFDGEAARAWLTRWRARRAAQGRDDEAGALMRANNPVVIPRNHLVEAALKAASEAGDLAPFEALLRVLARPYEMREGLERFRAPPQPQERVRATFCGT